MKDLDKGKCVRPARSARRGTDRLNGIAALSEKSAELTDAEVSLNWRVCVCVCLMVVAHEPRKQELKTQASEIKDLQVTVQGFFLNALALFVQV